MANCLLLFKLYEWETPTYLKTFGIIFFAYCPIIITINAFLISSIIATNQSLRNTSNLLIVFLSISDIIFGATGVPLISIENIWKDHPIVCAMQTVGPALQVFFFNNSIGITILLAIDRYLHMNPDFHRSPSRLAKLFKRPWIFILLFTIILLSAATAIDIHFSLVGGQKRLMITTVLSAITTLVAMIIIVGLYTRGYMRIRRHVAENPVYANRGPNEESPEYLKELFKTVLLLLIALTVSTLPVIITSLTISLAYFTGSGPSSSVVVESYLLAPFLVYTNAVTNAMIIFYRNKKSWDWLKNRFSRFCCCKQRGQEEQPDSIAVVCNVRETGVWNSTTCLKLSF